MLAAYYDRIGPAREVLTLGELPTPGAGPGEVRVAVACSGVNPSDVKTRAGLRSRTLSFPRIVPHSDGAGVIDQVGEDVSRTRIGERVWIWNGAWGRPYGSAAQYVVLPEQQAVPLVGEVGFDAGACLGIPALTACHAVLCNGGVVGETVLVQGGAGAVGHYAIQFARFAGARLIVATVSSDAKAGLARAAGAHVVLNYKSDDVASRCLQLTDGVGIDRIVELDLAANLSIDLSALRKHDGEITVYGSGAPEILIPFFPAIVGNVRLQFFIVYNLSSADRARAIDEVNRRLVDGSLQHNIAARFPLAKIADAHELVESGRAVGNVVIDIGAA